MLLEIHVIDRNTDAGTDHIDLQKEVIILCPDCHRFFHARPVEESIQRELVRYRPKEVKAAMRRIMGTRPRRYFPPETGDPEAIFAEMFASGSLDLCLNGG